MAHCDDCASLKAGQIFRETRDLAYMDEETISMVKVPGSNNQRRVQILDFDNSKVTIRTLTDIHGNHVSPRDTKISRKTLDKHYTFIAH